MGYVNKEIFKYKKTTATGPVSTVFERENTIVKKVKGPKIQEIDGYETLVSLISKIKDIRNSFETPIRKGIEDIFLLCKTPVLYSTPDVIRASIRNQNPVIKNGRIVSLALIEEIDGILKSNKLEYYREVLRDILNIEHVNIINMGQDLKNLIFSLTNGQENTINQIRRSISILKRRLGIARGEGKSYIYSNYNPRYAQYAITILRTFYNFCWAFRSGNGDVLTPAQRIGITDKQSNYTDIIYFS